MIRDFLTRIAARWLNRAAKKQRISQREFVKATAQSMRPGLGLPPHPALSTKEN